MIMRNRVTVIEAEAKLSIMTFNLQIAGHLLRECSWLLILRASMRWLPGRALLRTSVFAAVGASKGQRGYMSAYEGWVVAPSMKAQPGEL